MNKNDMEDKDPLLPSEKEPRITQNNEETEAVIVDLEPHLTIMRMGTAVFYAVSSFLITIVNKSILTSYQFPSFQFLGFSQMVTTIVVLFLAKRANRIKFPNFNYRIFFQIFPLPLIYAGNIVFGLGSTKELSLPMFTMLRRLSIFITMVGEYYLLNVRPKLSVQLAVGLIIMGAVIAAIQDLGFNAVGYVYVLINDFLTAGNNLFVKKKLDSKPEIGKYGIMFYCAVFMLPLSFLFLWKSGDFQEVVAYDSWLYFPFLVQFALSCTMGFILNYSIMLCTQFNSALTTTIIGCLKNIIVTYLGMFLGGDYVYSLENFIGINISVLGSIFYTYITFKRPNKSGGNPSCNSV